MTLTYSGNKNLLKMALDLLSKEEEYRAINKELENKTKELLKEVNAVMVNKSTTFKKIYQISFGLFSENTGYSSK